MSKYKAIGRRASEHIRAETAGDHLLVAVTRVADLIAEAWPRTSIAVDLETINAVFYAYYQATGKPFVGPKTKAST